MKRQRGMTVVFVLLALSSLIGFVALAVDAGLIYAARGALQTASDAGALAGVRALQSCNATEADRAAAVAAAQAAVAANPVVGRALVAAGGDITLGRVSGPHRTFSATTTNPDSVKVVVHEDAVRNGPLPLAIGAVLGRPIAHLDAAGIATRDRHVIGFRQPPGGKGKVLPFAADAAAFGPVGSRVQLFDGVTGSGNFGIIDLAPTGYTDSTFHASDPTVVDQIMNGFQGTLQLDPGGNTQTSGRTGTLGGSLSGALEARVGDVVIVSLYEKKPTGQGTDLIYRVTGFASLRIDRVQVTGKLSERGIFGTVVPVTEAGAITDPSAPESCLISKIQITR